MKNLKLAFLTLVLVLLGNILIIAQEINQILNDSTINRIEPIDISDISLKSSELKLSVKQEISDMISNDAVQRVKAENSLLLYTIDKGLFESIDPTDYSVSIRDLEQRQIKFEQVQQKIEEQKALLTGIIHKVDSFQYSLIQESERWKMTHKVLQKESLPSSISLKLSQTISFLDSTTLLISEKSSMLLGVIDKTIEAGIKLNAQNERNKSLIRTKHENALENDHPPFFNMKFKTDFGKEINGSIQKFVLVDLIELEEYLFANTDALWLSVIIFCGLVFMFVLIRKKVRIKDSGFGYYYKEILLKVISSPVSSSIILVMLFSILIFPDRPPIFREFSFYIIAFPLIHILDILVDRKYRTYIFSFGVLVILYMFILLLPTPNNLVIYRVLLLMIAASEITLITMLLRQFRINRGLLSSGNRISYSFIALHLALASIGFLANIFGRLILTEIILFAVFLNIFFGLILFVSTIILNGLIATGIDTRHGNQLNVIRMNGEIIKKNVIRALNSFAVILWILLFLRNFRILGTLYESLKSILTTKISIGSASFSLDGFLIFFVVIYVSVLISKILRIVLEEDVLNRLPLSKGLPHTIAMMVSYTLITASFFLAVNAAGIPVDKFTIILGAMSVGIGFGLQNIFNNLVSGLILLFERPIQLGDTVQVGQLTGNVKSIGIRSSNIRTFDGAEVIVPNGQLVSNEVINWTLSDQHRRIEIKIQVAYHSDPQLVRQLLRDMLNNHQEVLSNPEPAVFFHEFGESSLDFALLFWIGDYNEGRRIKSEILFQVFQILKDNKIEIPFPQRDIHIRTSNQQDSDVISKEIKAI